MTDVEAVETTRRTVRWSRVSSTLGPCALVLRQLATTASAGDLEWRYDFRWKDASELGNEMLMRMLAPNARAKC